MGFAGMIAAKIFGLPITTIYHTDLPEYARQLTGDFRLGNLVTSLTKAFYNQSEGILVPSNDYAVELMEWGINAEKIGFLRRWVDTDVFSPSKASQNGFYGHRKGVKLLYVGRISKEKNLDLLLHTHSELSRLSRDFNIYCIGDGPYLEELRKKTAHLENFQLLGPMYGEQLAIAYATADAFVFPSLTDTFGNVVLEAQASGLPCVVMHKGGPKEIVIDNRSGFVASSEPEFVAAIDNLILDSKLRTYMSKEAVSNAQRFDKSSIFAKFWQDVSGQSLAVDWKSDSDYGDEVSSLSYV
jgi:glycosyltransferase involved in cell wall biosynthesis